MDELTLILNAAEKRLQFILLQDEILLHAEESEPQKTARTRFFPISTMPAANSAPTRTG